MRTDFPIARAGMTVGLLGGSFDPPHAGHVHITREALKRFSLNRVWWLVSPANPLKQNGPAPLAERMTAARRVMDHPKVCVTGIEARLGTRRTADTIAALQAIYPGTHFVWLMGADNLAQMHLWHDWRQIVHAVPIGVLARPGERMVARMSPTSRTYRRYRLSQARSHLLARAVAPAWCFVNVPMLGVSSTLIRRHGGRILSATVGEKSGGDGLLGAESSGLLRP